MNIKEMVAQTASPKEIAESIAKQETMLIDENEVTSTNNIN